MKLACVEIGQVVQRMNAATSFGPAFPELEMKMGITRVFLTHRADQVALVHLCTGNHTLRDGVEMKMDKEQVILAVRRIEDLKKNMR